MLILITEVYIHKYILYKKIILEHNNVDKIDKNADTPRLKVQHRPQLQLGKTTTTQPQFNCGCHELKTKLGKALI